MSMKGYVYLVGAGPGDPGLLTLKGRECLAKADLVLYDGLVNPSLLRHTSADCEKAGRTDDHGVRRVQQDDINARLVEEALSGKTVVRLKGGDPFVFGRGSEEAAALRGAGVDYEIVPGVTSATTAGGYAGFPLTHRGVSSAVALVTGHEDPTKADSDLDYAALAVFPGTLVFYMGLHRLPSIAAALIENGKPADTLSAVVSRASTPRQRTVTAPLEEITDAVAAEGLRPPSLIIVGECVRLREQIAWFERRPLFGVSVGVARPVSRSEEALSDVTALGGEAVPLPTIELGQPNDFGDLDVAIETLGDFTHLAFTSVAAVGPFFERLSSAGLDSRSLSGLRTACVGPSTKRELEGHGVRCDVQPDNFNASELAKMIVAESSAPNVLWPCSDRGRDALPDGVVEAGGRVTAAVAYSNRDVESWPMSTLARLREGVDYVAVSSPSAATSLAWLWPEDAKKPAVVAASDLTAEAVRDAGWTCRYVSATPHWPDMLATIREAVAKART